MTLVGRDLKDHPVPPPAMPGTPSTVSQAAPSHVPPSLGHFQGSRGRHSFSGIITASTRLSSYKKMLEKWVPLRVKGHYKRDFYWVRFGGQNFARTNARGPASNAGIPLTHCQEQKNLWKPCYTQEKRCPWCRRSTGRITPAIWMALQPPPPEAISSWWQWSDSIPWVFSDITCS